MVVRIRYESQCFPLTSGETGVSFFVLYSKETVGIFDTGITMVAVFINVLSMESSNVVVDRSRIFQKMLDLDR